MIERHWKGTAKKEKAIEYISHLQNETFKHLSAIDGFNSAKILTRERKEGVEFLIVTIWESFEAIKRFSGPMLDKAVVPESAQKMMIHYDDVVSHYEIITEPPKQH